MLNLTIKDQVYGFRFGFGFVREIDKTKQQKGEDGATHDVGLQYAIASVIDGDPVALVDILLLANKTERDKVTKAILEEYIEDESTDIDAIFAEVLDFFKKGNCTKTKTKAIIELVEKEKAKAEKAAE